MSFLLVLEKFFQSIFFVYLHVFCSQIGNNLQSVTKLIMKQQKQNCYNCPFFIHTNRWWSLNHTSQFIRILFNTYFQCAFKTKERALPVYLTQKKLSSENRKIFIDFFFIIMHFEHIHLQCIYNWLISHMFDFCCVFIWIFNLTQSI